MSMRRARILALMLLAVACAPSQRRLLAGRHYDDALRGVQAGELAGATVLDAIDGDLQVGLHLQAVPAAAVRTQLLAAGQELPPGLDRVVIVRVIHDSNRVGNVTFTLSPSLLHRGTLLPAVDPDPATLAALLDPSGATNTAMPVGTRYRPVGMLELIGRVRLNAIGGGRIGPGLPTIDRPVAHTASTGPVAETLRAWLQLAGCSTSTGDPCRYHLLWPRPPQGGEAPLELAVSLSLHPRTAILYRFALPPGSLESSLAALFGDRVRTLQDLHRQHGRGRTVVYPLDVLERDPDGGFTFTSRRKLARLVAGTRRHRGLRAHRDLRFFIDPAVLPGGVPAAAELRSLLLGLGLADNHIEIRAIPGPPYEFRGVLVAHELPVPRASVPPPQ